MKGYSDGKMGYLQFRNHIDRCSSEIINMEQIVFCTKKSLSLSGFISRRMQVLKWPTFVSAMVCLTARQENVLRRWNASLPTLTLWAAFLVTELVEVRHPVEFGAYLSRPKGAKIKGKQVFWRGWNASPHTIWLLVFAGTPTIRCERKKRLAATAYAMGSSPPRWVWGIKKR